MAKVCSQSSGRGSELSTLIQCALIVIPFPFRIGLNSVSVTHLGKRTAMRPVQRWSAGDTGGGSQRGGFLIWLDTLQVPSNR